MIPQWRPHKEEKQKHSSRRTETDGVPAVDMKARWPPLEAELREKLLAATVDDSPKIAPPSPVKGNVPTCAAKGKAERR